MQKTKITKLKEVKRQWHLIDLKGEILGRIATRISRLLIGKNKPYFTPNLDCGDYIVCFNAVEIKVTGKKRKEKIYYRHSNYPGGLKTLTFEQLQQKDPRKIIRLAVKNMLPKNKLRRQRLARLKIFAGLEYDYKDKFKKSNLPD